MIEIGAAYGRISSSSTLLPIDVNGFNLGKELGRALTHFAEHPRAAVLEPAERSLDRRADRALVDFDHTGLGSLGEANRLAQIGGDDPGRETIAGIVGDREGFL